MVVVLTYLLAGKTLEAYTKPAFSEPMVNSAVSSELKSQEKSKIENNIIGYSYRGNIISDIIITPVNYNKTMLITFAVHGFEGSWYNDGSALTQIANDVIREFSNNPEELNTTRLIIVPCVNPDGIWQGKTDNGFGRCNGQGIDINRDFDYHWEFCNDPKYRTGNAPFATPEAQILRDLVLKEKPEIVIDFHGWLNCTYGDAELGKYFNKYFGIKNQNPISRDQVYMQQYFTGWASQFARTIMVEYPNPINPQNLIKWDYSNKTITAIKEICSKI